MRVLGIESSCDECAAAVVEDGRRVIANVVATQAEIHARYGGVVPEVASRRHLETMIPVVESALQRAGGWEQVDAIGATFGPGLAGSLLVGLNAGKALAFARGLPFIGVNHLEGHIYANWLEGYSESSERGLAPVLSTAETYVPPRFPALALVVSGGHTDLILMEEHGRYRRLGRTRDDAAGEAFDKVARLLDLGYPGGPVIEKIAAGVAPSVTLPRAWLPGTNDFSFSGLKTAVLHLTREPDHPPAPEIAAAFQESVVDVLAAKTARAAEEHNVELVMLAGGVAANTRLREAIVARSPVPVRYPPPKYCTDNAVMIAACAKFHLARGERSTFDLDVQPNLRFAE
jgi:N6-L-threonylcarbamoyladenine synthase